MHNENALLVLEIEVRILSSVSFAYCYYFFKTKETSFEFRIYRNSVFPIARAAGNRVLLSNGISKWYEWW